MVTIGIDSHKKTHTFVAVDDVGKKLADRTFKATTDGHLDALEWAERWPERLWAIEDCRHLTRRLESHLLAGGEAVLRVPTRLMAGERRGNRERGKSDPIDALAVARAALREPPTPSSSRHQTGDPWNRATSAIECGSRPPKRPASTACASTISGIRPGRSPHVPARPPRS